MPTAVASQPCGGSPELRVRSQPPSAAHFALTPAQPRAAIEALSPGRFKLVLTLDQDAHSKLEQLRALLRHQVPDGDLARVISLVVSDVLDRTLKRRFAVKGAAASRPASAPAAAMPAASVAATSEPAAALAGPERRRAPAALPERPKGRASSTVAGAAGKAPALQRHGGSRYIPRSVLRAVYERDGGRCTFVSEDGHRCGTRSFVEVHHHDVTFARGGAATLENLRLVCRAHNALFAERDYGRRFMRLRIEGTAQLSLS